MFNTLGWNLLFLLRYQTNHNKITQHNVAQAVYIALKPCLAAASVTFFLARLERETGKILSKLGSVQFTRALDAQ